MVPGLLLGHLQDLIRGGKVDVVAKLFMIRFEQVLQEFGVHRGSTILVIDALGEFLGPLGLLLVLRDPPRALVVVQCHQAQGYQEVLQRQCELDKGVDEGSLQGVLAPVDGLHQDLEDAHGDVSHAHCVEEEDPGDHAPVEPCQPLALVLACFIVDEESEDRKEERVHSDVKDELDELARALEGIKEDLVRSIKVNNPELQSKDGTQHKSNEGDRGKNQVLKLLIMRFR
jgi:hypothetical protein